MLGDAYVRAMDKAAMNTETKKQNIAVEFSSIDGKAYFRAKLQHSMPSKNKKSEHYGFLFPVVKCEVGEHDDGYSVCTSIVDAACTCPSQNKKCWHIAAVCYLVETMSRPEASLVPSISTDDRKQWHNGDRVVVSCDKTLPISRAKFSRNERRAPGSAPKVNKASMRMGTGGRMVSYSCVPKGLKLRERNDPEVLKALGDLYAEIRLVSEPCAAEAHWPAKAMPEGSYTEFPIDDPTYLLGENRQMPPRWIPDRPSTDPPRPRSEPPDTDPDPESNTDQTLDGVLMGLKSLEIEGGSDADVDLTEPKKILSTKRGPVSKDHNGTLM